MILTAHSGKYTRSRRALSHAASFVGFICLVVYLLVGFLCRCFYGFGGGDRGVKSIGSHAWRAHILTGGQLPPASRPVNATGLAQQTIHKWRCSTLPVSFCITVVSSSRNIQLPLVLGDWSAAMASSGGTRKIKHNSTRKRRHHPARAAHSTIVSSLPLSVTQRHKDTRPKTHWTNGRSNRGVG